MIAALALAFAWKDLEPPQFPEADRAWRQLRAAQGGPADPEDPVNVLAADLGPVTRWGSMLVADAFEHGRYPSYTADDPTLDTPGEVAAARTELWKTIRALDAVYLPMAWDAVGWCAGRDAGGAYDTRLDLQGFVQRHLAGVQKHDDRVLVVGFASPPIHRASSPDPKERQAAEEERTRNAFLAQERTQFVREALFGEHIGGANIRALAVADEGLFDPRRLDMDYPTPRYTSVCARSRSSNPADQYRQGVVVVHVPAAFFLAAEKTVEGEEITPPEPRYPELPEVDIPAGKVAARRQEDSPGDDVYGRVCVPMAQEGLRFSSPGKLDLGSVIGLSTGAQVAGFEAWGRDVNQPPPQRRREVSVWLEPGRQDRWNAVLARALLGEPAAARPSWGAWRVALTVLQSEDPLSTWAIPARTEEGLVLLQDALAGLKGTATWDTRQQWNQDYPAVVTSVRRFEPEVTAEAFLRPVLPSPWRVSQLQDLLTEHLRALSVVRVESLFPELLGARKVLLARPRVPVPGEYDRGGEERGWVNALWRAGGIDGRTFERYEDVLAYGVTMGLIQSPRMRCEHELAWMDG